MVLYLERRLGYAREHFLTHFSSEKRKVALLVGQVGVICIQYIYFSSSFKVGRVCISRIGQQNHLRLGGSFWKGNEKAHC